MLLSPCHPCHSLQFVCLEPAAIDGATLGSLAICLLQIGVLFDANVGLVVGQIDPLIVGNVTSMAVDGTGILAHDVLVEAHNLAAIEMGLNLVLLNAEPQDFPCFVFHGAIRADRHTTDVMPIDIGMNHITSICDVGFPAIVGR